MRLRLHAFEPLSLANGPGRRAVVWFQGCSLGCPQCFNPDTHDPSGGGESDTAELADQILAQPDIEGLSVSGGEPFQQPEALLDLLTRVRSANLSVLVFSGYTLAEIRRLPSSPATLALVDVLIDGRYDATAHLGRHLLGSSNQRMHLLTPRHTLADFSGIPAGEVIIRRDGSMTLSGVSPLRSSRIR